MDDFGVRPAVSQALFRAQQQLRGTLRDSLRAGIVLGQVLCMAKQQCRHGEFGLWVNRHFEGTDRMARNYMSLAHQFPHPDQVPTLSLREALRLMGGKREPQSAAAVTENDRVTPHTAEVVIGKLALMAETLNSMTEAVEAEGFTPCSVNIKKIRTLRAHAARVRSHFAAQARTQTTIG